MDLFARKKLISSNLTYYFQFTKQNMLALYPCCIIQKWFRNSCRELWPQAEKTHKLVILKEKI